MDKADFMRWSVQSGMISFPTGSDGWKGTIFALGIDKIRANPSRVHISDKHSDSYYHQRYPRFRTAPQQ